MWLVFKCMYPKYLPKRKHFGYVVMIHASMLAALNHSNNANREQVGELSSFLCFVRTVLTFYLFLTDFSYFCFWTGCQDFKMGGVLVNRCLLRRTMAHDNYGGRCSLLCVRFKPGHGHESEPNTYHGSTRAIIQITDHFSNTAVFMFQVVASLQNTCFTHQHCSNPHYLIRMN